MSFSSHLAPVIACESADHPLALPGAGDGGRLRAAIDLGACLVFGTGGNAARAIGLEGSAGRLGIRMRAAWRIAGQPPCRRRARSVTDDDSQIGVSDPPGVGVDGSPGGEEDGVTGMVVFPWSSAGAPGGMSWRIRRSAPGPEVRSSHTLAVRGKLNPSRFLSRNCC